MSASGLALALSSILLLLTGAAHAGTLPRADRPPGLALGVGMMAGSLGWSGDRLALQGALVKPTDAGAWLPDASDPRWESAMRAMWVIHRGLPVSLGVFGGVFERPAASTSPAWSAEGGVAMSMRFSVPWNGGYSSLIVTPALTLSVNNERRKIELGPSTGLEVALELAPGLEVTAGGGSLVGMRLML